MILSAVRRRAALGLAPTAVPVSAYIPLGALFGPHGANVLTVDVLAHLDPLVSVTLGTIGVLVGIAIGERGRHAGRLIAAAAVESSLTFGIVTVAVGLLMTAWQLPLTGNPWLLASVLGACAAASAAGAADAGTAHADVMALTVADFDDFIPIAVGAIALAFTPSAGDRMVVTQIAETIGVGLSAGLVGWLLFDRAENAGERGVFVLGTLGLLAGAAAYLALSPLLAGLICGLFWRLAPGRADDIVARDLQRYHHPFVLLLLVAAGAAMEPRLSAVWLFAPFVLFRLTGKLIGGAIASGLHSAIAGDALGAYLIPPGVVGIAVALNLAQVAPADGALVITAVGGGAVMFELIALFVAGRRE